MLTFTDRLIEAIQRKKSILCVGLDPQLRYMPEDLCRKAVEQFGPTMKAIEEVFSWFNRFIIHAIRPYAVCVKPQTAFYEAYGSHGIRAFEETTVTARGQGLILIEDAKRGDGSDTATAYAQGHIGRVPFWGKRIGQLSAVEGPMRVDAVTIHGYIGTDCVGAFQRQIMKHGTGAFVVDKTSFNPNSEIEQLVTQRGLSVWEELAHCVAKWAAGTEGYRGYTNLGVVMGATYPDDARKMRAILPRAWMLVPGYGKQGGGADGAVVAVNEDGFGAVVNSSRGVIYAKYFDDQLPEEQRKYKGMSFAEAAGAAAKEARDDLNAALRRAGKGLDWLPEAA